MMISNDEKYYYNIEYDITEYPQYWCYLAIGGRNTGKTYSALKYHYQNKIKFVFVKRTDDDIKLLCSGSGSLGKKEYSYSADLSPFKSINRDIGSNVKAFQINKHLGGFWICNVDGEALGDPIGYIISLTSIAKIKGFDLSECDSVIFDEYIPNKYERVNKSEGEQLLDLLKTVGRDREHKGRGPLKLYLLANATRAACPIHITFGLVDIIVNMDINNQEFYYDEYKGILIHKLEMSEEFMCIEKQSYLFRAFGDTDWGKMAFGNNFGYDDFSDIRHQNLNKFRQMSCIKYQNKFYTIYEKDGFIVIRESNAKKNIELYDLNKKSNQIKFYNDYVLGLLYEATIEERAAYDSYLIYDLIMNYKKHFTF